MRVNPDITGLRRYAHAIHETDEELSLFLEAAKEWLSNADVPDYAAKGALYTLAVYMLATHWLDNRAVMADAGSSAEVPLGVMSIMHQLRSTPKPETEATT